MVGVVDYHVWGQDVSRYSARSQTERHRVGWAGDEPETLDWIAALRRIRDRRWSFSSLAPYTIFPLSADDATDVVMGFVDVFCSVNLPSLERALTQDGVDVAVRRAGQGKTIFLEAHRRGVGVRVPAHVREQMMVELMTPDALFALLDHVLTLNEQRPEEANDRRVVTFADEAAVWERPGRAVRW